MLTEKSCICVLLTYRKLLEWTMRKKGIPEVLVRSVMSLYEGLCNGVETVREFTW